MNVQYQMNSFPCDKKKKMNLNQENIYPMRTHGVFRYKFETLFLILDFSIISNFWTSEKLVF